MSLDGCPLSRLQTMNFLTGTHIPKTTTKTSWIWLLNILQSQRYWNKCEYIWYFSICLIWFNFTTWQHFCGLVSTIYCFWLVVPLFTRSAHGISCKAFFFQNLFNCILWGRLPHMFQCGVFFKIQNSMNSMAIFHARGFTGTPRKTVRIPLNYVGLHDFDKFINNITLSYILFRISSMIMCYATKPHARKTI